jgi:hypothetical protein
MDHADITPYAASTPSCSYATFPLSHAMEHEHERGGMGHQAR